MGWICILGEENEENEGKGELSQLSTISTPVSKWSFYLGCAS